ncbi:VWA domain-containing protein [Pseudorhodobacter sp. E13]|uniref:vWA domain-containing protein n=1 Tax=Pseudorhodobacter sp. E13 TaxID=2487931 RepID=UPI000F8C7220|nr:vWA domain-containing protein [Pseudorhodobacter sp. E13]RUS65181.1 VWA domain-containing protein [Pseudorhodobacter sp. E13]
MTLPINPGSTLPLNAATGPSIDTTIPAGLTDQALANLPVLRVTKRHKMPNGVASNVKQHVVYCVDHSTSMSGAKLQELLMALDGHFLQLADASNKDGFSVTIIPFNNSSYVHCAALPANAVPPLNLVAAGGTNFDSPIKKTIAEIESLKAAPNVAGWHWLRPQVLFLSDGQATVSDKNLEDLHEIADVTAIAYGDDADQGTLARISSRGEVHLVGTDSGALRGFLAVVGQTLVSTLQASN